MSETNPVSTVGTVFKTISVSKSPAQGLTLLLDFWPDGIASSGHGVMISDVGEPDLYGEGPTVEAAIANYFSVLRDYREMLIERDVARTLGRNQTGHLAYANAALGYASPEIVKPTQEQTRDDRSPQ